MRGKIAPAARAVGVGLTTVQARRKGDADFDAAVIEAIDECVDDMEAEMIRRAKEGVHKPVIHQGQLQYLTEPVLDEEGQVLYDDKGRMLQRLVHDDEGKPVPLTLNERSDALLMFGLKGYRKHFATDRTELTGADGKDLATGLSEVERTSRIAAIMELARKRAEDDIG
jgi:hypothetical protein